MNKIKDFFYKRNDVMIVLIILIAAGLLIYNRIGVIMEYPEKLAEQNAANKAEQMIDDAQDAQDVQDSDKKSDKDSEKSDD